MSKFIESIIKNANEQIKYKNTITNGEITVDNGDGTYDVKIANASSAIPNVETVLYGESFSVGEIVVIGFEYGCKEAPKILGHAKKIKQEPKQVEVDYSGGVRAITLGAYAITYASAYLQGEIELNGLGNCTRRGFHYGKTIAYGSDVYEDGSYGEGTFNKQITELDPETTYHFQAYVLDANGDEQVGIDKSFTTSIYTVSYIYCAGHIGTYTINNIWKIIPTDLSKISEIDYGQPIFALATDGTYIYCAGHSYNGKVWKIDPSNMSKIAESADYGGMIYALTILGNYIYCGGATTNKVWKIKISDMVKVAESADYGGDILSLTTDGTYIYCGGYASGTLRRVWKIDPSNMSKIAESVDCGANINALNSLGNYIYCGLGLNVRKVWKIQISDMVKVAESADYGGTNGIYSLTNDGTYIYCGGDVTQKVWKITPSDMVKVAESADYGTRIMALTTDGTYIYCGGLRTDPNYQDKVWKIKISDMVKVAESASYGGDIRALI